MFINTNNYVTGLSGTGIETEKVVDQYMTSLRTKYDKMDQQKQKAVWKQEAYLDLNTQISSFRDKVFDLKLQSNFNVKKTTATNEKAVSIVAGSTAVLGNMTMSIQALAEGANLTSQSSLAAAGTVDADGKFTSAVSFQLNGKAIYTYKTDADGNALDADGNITTDTSKYVLKSASAVAAEMKSIEGLNASYDAGTGRFFLSTSSSGSDMKIELDSAGLNLLGMDSAPGVTKNYHLQSDLSTDDMIDTSGKFTVAKTMTINGIEVKTVNDNGSFKSVDDLVREISKIDGVREVSYDAKTGKFSLSGAKITRDSSGKITNYSQMELAGDLDAIGISAGAEQQETQGVYGKDAKFILNGAEFTQSTNNFTINGLTFNLKETTGDESFNITTETDVDGIYENIKSFVDAYNEIISTINGYTKTKPDRDYPPLTETQKKELEDDEVKDWQEKAKQGILYNDSILTSLTSSMRMDLSSNVTLSDGSKKNIFQIGIDTGSYATNGKLEINEDKLKAAIAEDPEAIVQFFTANGKADTAENGIFQRIQESLDKATSRITAEAGSSVSDSSSTLYKSIAKLKTSMDDEMDRLKEKEEWYYKQFSLMETYISQMSSQMSLFSS